MINPSSWMGLSLESFFSHANWEGRPLKQPTPQAPVQAVAALQLEMEAMPVDASSWLCLTVQAFFDQTNWQGQLQMSARSPQAQIASVEAHAAIVNLSLTLPVSDFFQHIDWSGKPKIGALPTLQAVPQSDSRTLMPTNLSYLF
jgi:hypothetical protein